MNGCLCCTVREDLAVVLNKLFKRGKNRSKLDGIVTLIDAKHIEQHIEEEKTGGPGNGSLKQVACADRILLNKMDLMSEADLDRIESRLRAINDFALIQRCCNS